MRKKENIGQPRLSLCMIVKNEAHNLRDCLQLLKSVLDEIVIVDTGSTDETKSIARELGASVYDFAWREDFALARNESIRQATGEYILWLDADDRIDEQEIYKIELLKKSLPPFRDKAYYFIVNSQSPVDGETHFRQIRIFPNRKGVLFEGRVHEQIYYSLKRQGIKFENTDIFIRHLGYSDEETILKKAKRNLKIIDEELKKRPYDLVLHYNAARTLAMIGRQREAIAHIKVITENKRIWKFEKQFFLEASLLMGKYYVELGDYPKAISIFDALSKEFKKNGLIYFCLGQAHYLSQNYKEAEKELLQATLIPIEVGLMPLNLQRFHYDLYYTLGQCYLKKGELGLAKEMFFKSLGFIKEPYKSYQALGRLCLAEGNFKETIKYYEKLIESHRAADQDYANIGLAYRKLGLYQAAEKALIKALEINEERIEALTNLGILYYENKNYQQAEKIFNKALALDPNLMDIRLMLSDIYFRFGELDNLIGQCEILLKNLNLPYHLVINNLMELSALYTQMADAFCSQGQDGLALLALKNAFLIFPNEEVLAKIVNQAAAMQISAKTLKEIKEIIEFHQQKAQLIRSTLRAN